MDVIENARAAATYQIADLMAWTGIDDAQVAVNVAGWAGYEIGDDSQTLSLSVEEEMVELTRDLPINLTIYPIDPESDDALRQVAAALGEILHTTNLANVHQLRLFSRPPPFPGVSKACGEGSVELASCLPLHSATSTRSSIT